MHAQESNGSDHGVGALPLPSDVNGDSHLETMQDATEPMAIVGFATRFPEDASNSGNLWELLLKGRSAWSEFPEDRIGASGHYHPDPEHGGTVSSQD